MNNGYTVKDIQEVMGFENPQAVYKWLSGKSLPSLDNLLILSKVLHTSIEDILVIDGDITILLEGGTQWIMYGIKQILGMKEKDHGSPSCLGTEYVDEHGISCNDECHVEWDKILDEMIFLFREMNEDTCQKKNPYQKEHEDVLQEFEAKYGIFGEKLEEGKKNKHGRVLHFPSEILEYKDIEEKYYAEEKALIQYREDCKNEALELFSK